MENEALEQVMVEVVCDLQRTLGHPTSEVTRNTSPHKDLSWFDSHLALLAAVEIETRIKCSMPDENIFATKDGQRLLRISEVAANLEEFAAIRQ